MGRRFPAARASLEPDMWSLSSPWVPVRRARWRRGRALDTATVESGWGGRVLGKLAEDAERLLLESCTWRVLDSFPGSLWHEISPFLAGNYSVLLSIVVVPLSRRLIFPLATCPACWVKSRLLLLLLPFLFLCPCASPFLPSLSPFQTFAPRNEQGSLRFVVLVSFRASH